jgi:hypothetical protein
MKPHEGRTVVEWPATNVLAGDRDGSHDRSDGPKLPCPFEGDRRNGNNERNFAAAVFTNRFWRV